MGTDESLVLTALKIIGGDVGLIQGCRSIVRMGRQSEGVRQDLFGVFRLVDSETDDVPMGDVRSLWDPRALAAKDQAVAEYLERVRPLVLEACERLIGKLGPPAGERAH